MPFDVGAETLQALSDAAYERCPMTRRHRHELHSLDVQDDVAMALFGVRSRRRRWLAFAIACPDLEGRWEVIWTGRATDDAHRRLEPRAPAPRGSGGLTRHLHDVMATGYSGWRYVIARAAVGVEQVRAADHLVDVPASGWVATVWPAEEQATIELLDLDGRVLGWYRPRTGHPWGMKNAVRRILHRGWT